MILGVNIDHIAVLKEARRVNDPDPLHAISLVAEAGAGQITIHLREDRRHINDDDAARIVRNSMLPVNLECSVNEEIIAIVCGLKPHRATLVPEKREEVTTEGGLDVAGQMGKVKAAVERLHAADIGSSLFIDPTPEMIKASKEAGAEMVEFHTGHYANLFAMLHTNLSRSPHSIKELELPRKELAKLLEEETTKLKNAAVLASEAGLEVAAGHGLNYQNVEPVARICEIAELNIGQSIIARSVFTGIKEAVREMRALMP